MRSGMPLPSWKRAQDSDSSRPPSPSRRSVSRQRSYLSSYSWACCEHPLPIRDFGEPRRLSQVHSAPSGSQVSVCRAQQRRLRGDLGLLLASLQRSRLAARLAGLHRLRRRLDRGPPALRSPAGQIRGSQNRAAVSRSAGGRIAAHRACAQRHARLRRRRIGRVRILAGLSRVRRRTPQRGRKDALPSAEPPGTIAIAS